MLETVRGVVGNARKNTFFFSYPQLSLRFMGRHDSLGRQLNHITGLGAGRLDTWVLAPSLVPRQLWRVENRSHLPGPQLLTGKMKELCVYVCMSRETVQRHW